MMAELAELRAVWHFFLSNNLILVTIKPFLLVLWNKNGVTVGYQGAASFIISYVMFWLSQTEVSVRDSQVFGQASVESCGAAPLPILPPKPSATGYTRLQCLIPFPRLFRGFSLCIRPCNKYKYKVFFLWKLHN